MAIFNPEVSNGNTNNSRKSATAFLNFSLELNGKKYKIVGAPLYEERVFDRQLIEALKDDPEKAQALVSKLVLKFNMADGSSSEPLDLSFLDSDSESESAAA